LKVLIVDDEEHVREAIELLVDWDKFGINERLMAEDGKQAMELIRLHHPAVLFCDMSMPRMDGTELLRQLREENREMQIIVVSGYDNYEYTRAAIRAVGVDYLLKPLRKSDLEQALERATAAWRANESSKMGSREAEYRLRQADAILDEQKLAAYFRGESHAHEGVRGLLDKIGHPLENTGVALVLLRNVTEIVNRRYDGDAELFIFAVNNIAQEVLHPHGSHFLCRLEEHQWVMLITSGERRDADSYMSDMQRVAEAWHRTLGLLTFVGYAGPGTTETTLQDAVGDARQSLLKCDVLHSGQSRQPSGDVPRLTDQQVLLEAAMSAGNKSYAADIIHGFVQTLRERGSLSLKQLQACTLEANLLLERASMLHPGNKEMSELSLPLWISDLEEWEHLLVQHWWRLMEESAKDGSGNHAIHSMREYMERHYDEDISLSSLSERFHFSPQYIAKKFKEFYNTTVITYLTELRIEKARSLLLHTDLPVLEIANTLGYSDENYFGKVFKKMTGLSPLQYRKQSRSGSASGTP